MTKEEITQAQREKSLAKARATRARNAENRAKQEAKDTLKLKREELVRVKTTIPTLCADYDKLLSTLSKEAAFDKKKWNRLDSLQNNIIGQLSRQRTLETELDVR